MGGLSAAEEPDDLKTWRFAISSAKFYPSRAALPLREQIDQDEVPLPILLDDYNVVPPLVSNSSLYMNFDKGFVAC